ncbi:MAG: hypothetical protein GY909_04865 [Oligoflexia bacterium]|nr:hypothetical protein [Oligoflexia bacterium]
MMVVLLVGTIFLIFGVLFSLLYLHFLNNAKTLPAKVYAIEKYISKTRSRNSSSSSVFYRPIIQYNFQGNEVLFQTSYGSSQVHHEIGQRVKVLSLNKGEEYVRLKGKIAIIFPLIFIVIGLGLLTFFFLQKHSLNFIILSVSLSLTGPLILYFQLKRKNLFDQMIDHALKTKVLTDDDLAKKTIFKSNAELNKELNKNFKIGFIMTLIFLAPCLYGVNYFYSKTKPENIEKIKIFFSDFSQWKIFQTIDINRDKEFLGFLILSFFSLMLIYSLIFQVKNRK